MREVYLEKLGASHGEYPDAEAGIAVTHFPFEIGRGNTCDQSIPHLMISRSHCALFLQDDEIHIRDLGSRNGTFLNGRPVESPQPLRGGDILKLASLYFIA